MIEGTLRPWPNLKTVHEAAMGEGSCQFATNIALVNRVLQNQREQSAGSIDTGLEFFCDRFRGLVRDMLKEEPAFRPSASRALDTIKKIDSDLAIFLDTSILQLCITLRGKDTRLVEVDLSELKTDADLMKELNRRYRGIASRSMFTRRFYGPSWINYVKFAIHDPDRPIVRIVEHSTPPQKSNSHDHAYYGSPSFFERPIEAEIFMHRLVDPSMHPYGTFLCKNIPRRFGPSSRSQLIDTRRAVHGWGLEIVEDIRLVYVFFSVTSLWLILGPVSMVICLIWCEDSQQAKMVFSTWIFGICFLVSVFILLVWRLNTRS